MKKMYVFTCKKKVSCYSYVYTLKKICTRNRTSVTQKVGVNAFTLTELCARGASTESNTSVEKKWTDLGEGGLYV